MAEKDAPDDNGPSLELPSFGFGRKRRRSQEQDEPTEATEPEPTPQPTPDPEPEPEPEPEPARTVVMDPVAHEPAEPAKPLYADEVETQPEPTPAPEPEPEGTRKARKPRNQRSLPALGPYPAALFTGLVVGVLMVGMTWGSLRLCEVVRGTSSCGKPGFLVLLVIIVIAVLLGAAMLRAWNINDSGSAAFLGVGIVAVVALLFLIDVIFEWWMIITIPLISAVGFAIARWITSAFVELDSGPQQTTDIR